MKLVFFRWRILFIAVVFELSFLSGGGYAVARWGIMKAQSWLSPMLAVTSLQLRL